jgi:CTP synthase
MVSYLPVPGSIGEMKTKPTQTAVRALNSTGVFADIIIARSSLPIDEKRKEKIARFCNVQKDHVIAAPDVESIYDIPLHFEREDLSARLLSILGVSKKESDLSAWKRFATKTKKPKATVRIAVVGKYFNSGDFVLSDVYLSVLEALKYSAYGQRLFPEISYLSASDFTDAKKCALLKQYDGILVPGGFGATGIEGKLNVISYARTHQIPYFGICYGMQLMVVEFARKVAKLAGAHTTEIDTQSPYPVIDIMTEQKDLVATQTLGGTMRLGAYPCYLKLGSVAAGAYGSLQITERHRHRYEVNPEYVEKLTAAGLVFSGTSTDGHLMEVAELPKQQHPFFLGVQFHPELIARPLRPHPLFTAFIKAASRQQKHR